MGDHVEQLKTITLKAIKNITSKKALEVIDKFPLGLDKRETGETVPQPGPSTSRSDIELSLSDADSGFVEQPDDISRNEQQVVPGTDLSTSVSIVDLNGVHHGATTSAEPLFINCKKLCQSRNTDPIPIIHFIPEHGYYRHMHLTENRMEYFLGRQVATCELQNSLRVNYIRILSNIQTKW